MYPRFHGETNKTMKFTLGTKQYMTQFFKEDGRVQAATVVAYTPLTVTQVKEEAKDGYAAVQVGLGTQKKSRVSKAQLGAWGDLGTFQYVVEFPVSEGASFKRGDTILPQDIFTPGDVVAVRGITKGKGFQGVVKRHGFGGGRRTHGQKHSEREPGSIGGGGRAGGRVVKGMRMAGRMGGNRITVRNLPILAVNPETQTMVIGGALPGRRGTLLEIVSIA